MSHSEEGENYWPGYVDALTSMVQVLAFVMMMLAMAVFVLSQSVSKSAVEAIAKAVKADVKPNANLKELTQAVMDRLPNADTPPAPAEKQPPRPSAPADAATDPNPDRISEMRLSGSRRSSFQPPVQPPLDAPRLTIGFEERSFRIEQERAQSLTKFLDENKVVERTQGIVINAYAYSGDGALSEARRLAYYRAMMARKQLVDAKVRPDNIRINVNDTAGKETGSTIELIVAGGNGAH